MVELLGQIKLLPVKAENNSFISDMVRLEYLYDNQITLLPPVIRRSV
jgi:hypothetical protein